MLLPLQTYSERGVGSQRNYKIDIFNLAVGEYEYDFDFSDDFFQNFDNSPVQRGSGKVKIELSKSETFLELSFDISGKIELICDRSLDPFEYPIEVQKRLVFKFGSEEEELSDEIVMIPWDSNSIELGQYIYEFIAIEIPMKKLHPRFQQDMDDIDTEDEIIYSSDDGTVQESNGDLDPRWEKLKELKTKSGKN